MEVIVGLPNNVELLVTGKVVTLLNSAVEVEV
jgi:hypothetical protein